jgi:hypothetical protein
VARKEAEVAQAWEEAARAAAVAAVAVVARMVTLSPMVVVTALVRTARARSVEKAERWRCS